jgi:uncharacterized caspase-like protein
VRDDQEVPVTDDVSDTYRDFGIVIGIEHYPYFRPLPGAANDATSFFDWLCDRDGGGLARSQATLILSDPDIRTPSQDEIDETLLTLLQAAEACGGGRRLYFYFSGHGASGDGPQDIALLLTRWSQLRVGLALSAERYARVLCGTGLFEEVAMFIDCCRALSMAPIGVAPTFTREWNTDQRPTRMFRAYATDAGLRAYESGDTEHSQGLFTRYLLSTLRQSSGLSAAALRERLFERVTSEAGRHGLQQRPYVENNLAETSRFGVDRKRLPVLELRFGKRRGRVILRDGTGQVVAEHHADDQPWRLAVKPGLYRVEGGGREPWLVDHRDEDIWHDV